MLHNTKFYGKLYIRFVLFLLLREPKKISTRKFYNYPEKETQKTQPEKIKY